MKKKNNKKWTLVLVLLLVVSIGYAALASNLKINGTTGVKSATWDVYWNNVQVTQGSVETTQGNGARITDQKKTQVEYSVVLSEPGDFYEFTVDAVNNGTIDAMIASQGIVNGVYSDSTYETPATLPDAVSYTVTYADGTEIQEKHLLAKKTNGVPTTETYKVRIEYRNDDEIDPDDLDNNNDQTYYFKFSVNYVQADNTAIDRNGGSSTTTIKPVVYNTTYDFDDETYSYTRTLSLKTISDSSDFSLGDYVKIGDNDGFYVIGYDSQKVKLITASVLRENGTQQPICVQSDPSSEDYVPIASEYFSNTQYWCDGCDEESEILSYKSNFNIESDNWAYVYRDSSNNDTPNNIYPYVNMYKTYLEGLIGSNVLDARLMSYDEAKNNGCTESYYSCPIYLINEYDDNKNDDNYCGSMYGYFIGSALIDEYGYPTGFIYEDELENISSTSSSEYKYIRPVIEVPLSLFE